MLFRLTIVGVAGLVGAVLGGLGRCLYADNHATNLEFLGVRGYEAGALVGELAGFILAGTAALAFLAVFKCAKR